MLPRTLSVVVAAILLPLSVPAAEGTLRVVATNVKNDKGSIYVWVYDKPDTWLSDKYRTQASVKVAGNRQSDTVALELQLPPGQYALSVFHDANANGKLERNFIGIPKEPSALSNNVRPRFGPPKYKDAVFTVGTEPVEQKLKLE